MSTIVEPASLDLRKSWTMEVLGILRQQLLVVRGKQQAELRKTSLQARPHVDRRRAEQLALASCRRDGEAVVFAD
jgi:hypothetical protein